MIVNTGLSVVVTADGASPLEDVPEARHKATLQWVRTVQFASGVRTPFSPDQPASAHGRSQQSGRSSKARLQRGGFLPPGAAGSAAFQRRPSVSSSSQHPEVGGALRLSGLLTGVGLRRRGPGERGGSGGPAPILAGPGLLWGAGPQAPSTSPVSAPLAPQSPPVTAVSPASDDRSAGEGGRRGTDKEMLRDPPGPPARLAG